MRPTCMGRPPPHTHTYTHTPALPFHVGCAPHAPLASVLHPTRSDVLTPSPACRPRTCAQEPARVTIRAEARATSAAAIAGPVIVDDPVDLDCTASATAFSNGESTLLLVLAAASQQAALSPDELLTLAHYLVAGGVQLVPLAQLLQAFGGVELMSLPEALAGAGIELEGLEGLLACAGLSLRGLEGALAAAGWGVTALAQLLDGASLNLLALALMLLPPAASDAPAGPQDAFAAHSDGYCWQDEGREGQQLPGSAPACVHGADEEEHFFAACPLPNSSPSACSWDCASDSGRCTPDASAACCSPCFSRLSTANTSCSGSFEQRASRSPSSCGGCASCPSLELTRRACALMCHRATCTGPAPPRSQPQQQRQLASASAPPPPYPAHAHH